MSGKTNTVAVSAIRQENAIADIKAERLRQDDQWGVQNHHPAYWLAILGKQVGQLGSEILNREWAAPDGQYASPVRMREEAVQTAAVALALIEAIDRGDLPVGLTTAKPSDPRQLAHALGKGDESLDYDKDQS